MLKCRQRDAYARFLLAGDSEPGPALPPYSPGMMADFIAPQDRLMAYLAIAIYGQRPQQIMAETELLTYSPTLSDIRVGVWFSCQTAYVVFRGTSVGKPKGLDDIIDDLVLASDDTCQLTISDQGLSILQQVYDRGYRDIRLSGHSLGGRGAMCNSTQPGVTKVVVLNAAAPVTAPTNIGPGPAIATHYHIAGDLISTHMSNAAANIVRMAPNGIRMVDQKSGWVPWIPDNLPQVYDFDWFSGFYHSSDRFLASGGGGTPVTAQQEEDALEWYMLFGSRQRVLALSQLSSIFGPAFFEQFNELLCENPIDGAQQSPWCKKEMDPAFRASQEAVSWLFGIVGAIIGLVAGPGGAAAGFSAGKGFYKGDLTGLLGTVFPGYALLKDAVQVQIEKFANSVLKAMKKKKVRVDVNNFDPRSLLGELGMQFGDKLIENVAAGLT